MTRFCAGGFLFPTLSEVTLFSRNVQAHIAFYTMFIKKGAVLCPDIKWPWGQGLSLRLRGVIPLIYHTSSSIHSVFCLTTGPKPPPKRFLHIVRSWVSSFNWEYPLLSLKSSSSFLRLLPRLLVTSVSPFIFPSITCFRRQLLRKLWPIQLAFRFHTS